MPSQETLWIQVCFNSCWFIYHNPFSSLTLPNSLCYNFPCSWGWFWVFAEVQDIILELMKWCHSATSFIDTILQFLFVKVPCFSSCDLTTPWQVFLTRAQPGCYSGCCWSARVKGLKCFLRANSPLLCVFIHVLTISATKRSNLNKQHTSSNIAFFAALHIARSVAISPDNEARISCWYYFKASLPSLFSFALLASLTA